MRGLLRFALLKSTPVPAVACSPKDLEALTGFVLKREAVPGTVELTVDLTSPRRIQRLNRRFRGVDRTTDVISFRNAAPPKLEGDIAINLHQAALQAKAVGHPLRREVRLLLIHGILHLVGYTDYQPRPRRKMFRRQNRLLREWEGKR